MLSCRDEFCGSAIQRLVPQRKAKHAAAIRRWKPWAHATGPKTAAGKQKSAANSFKYGGRNAQMRMFALALARQNRYRRLLLLYARARKQNPANELLKPVWAYLAREGPEVTSHLARVFQIMQKSCNFRPPGANS